MTSGPEQRLYESLASELGAFIYDRRLLDDVLVEDIISKNQLLKAYLRRWENGDIVVWYIDITSLEKRCRYTCGGIREPKEFSRCVLQCKYSELEKLKTEIMENLNNLKKQL
ncbi:MAG: hypothetical protein F7C32_04070 [Desulfurococcales archaeon]|nr:hypothetical protein [Desulfurococcales archaeon]